MTVQFSGVFPQKDWVSTAMFAVYIAAKWSRAPRVPGVVFWIATAMALGIPGGWGSVYASDVWTPISLSLAAVSVMGLFVAEYHREEDLRLISTVAILALPIACYCSIRRNGLGDQWSAGSRTGINLIGYFLATACVYAMTLRSPYVFLSLLPMLLLAGSRTSITMVAILLLLYPRFLRLLSRKSFQIVLVIGVLLLIGRFAFAERFDRKIHDLTATYEDSFSHAERFKFDDVRDSFMTRFNITDGWFENVIKRPSLFGHGSATYGWQDENIYFPHNGILHVFNGMGIPAGVIYTLSLAWLVKLYFEKRRALPDVFSWAGAFLIAVCFRMFTEAQLIVEVNHVSGFLLCYGCGLAMLGITSAAPKPPARAGRRNPKRPTSRIVGEMEPS
jgi:hypothetical protein